MTHERFANPLEFDIALIPPISEMMRRGFLISERKREDFRRLYKGRWIADQGKLDIVVGSVLNVNSPKQVMMVMYELLKLPPRRHKGKLTSDENAIRALLAICMGKMQEAKTEQTKEKWLRSYLVLMLILRIRGTRKRLSSYIDIEIDPDRRMRTTLTIGGTETGRFSSSKTAWKTGCNLQTIPKELRGMFLADDGKEMCEFDLNRGESWVYSHLSEDPIMMEIHQSGGDFHAETAAAISGAFDPESKSAKDIIEGYKAGEDWAYKLRFLGKKINHASAYRMGPFKAAEEVNKEADDTGITITVGQARVAQTYWREKYIGIRKWWSEIERQLNVNRTLVTPYGRKRTFYGHWGDQLFKDATAYVPQGTSVDYLNLGILDVYNALSSRGAFGLQLLHQNHDSLIVQYDTGRREEAIPEIIRRIERPLQIGEHLIKIPVEASHGPSWGDLEDWEG